MSWGEDVGQEEGRAYLCGVESAKQVSELSTVRIPKCTYVELCNDCFVIDVFEVL